MQTPLTWIQCGTECPLCWRDRSPRPLYPSRHPFRAILVNDGHRDSRSMGVFEDFLQLLAKFIDRLGWLRLLVLFLSAAKPTGETDASRTAG